MQALFPQILKISKKNENNKFSYNNIFFHNIMQAVLNKPDIRLEKTGNMAVFINIGT